MGSLSMKRVSIYLILLVVTAFYLGPFLWMLLTTTKTTAEAAAGAEMVLPWASGDIAGLAARHISGDAGGAQQRYLITRYNYEKVLTDPAFDFILYPQHFDHCLVLGGGGGFLLFAGCLFLGEAGMARRVLFLPSCWAP